MQKIRLREIPSASNSSHNQRNVSAKWRTTITIHEIIHMIRAGIPQPTGWGIQRNPKFRASDHNSGGRRADSLEICWKFACSCKKNYMWARYYYLLEKNLSPSRCTCHWHASLSCVDRFRGYANTRWFTPGEEGGEKGHESRTELGLSIAKTAR